MFEVRDIDSLTNYEIEMYCQENKLDKEKLRELFVSWVNRQLLMESISDVVSFNKYEYDLERMREDGHNDGFDEGREEGYDNGYESGFQDGINAQKGKTRILNNNE